MFPWLGARVRQQWLEQWPDARHGACAHCVGRTSFDFRWECASDTGGVAFVPSEATCNPRASYLETRASCGHAHCISPSCVVRFRWACYAYAPSSNCNTDEKQSLGFHLYCVGLCVSRFMEALMHWCTHRYTTIGFNACGDAVAEAPLCRAQFAHVRELAGGSKYGWGNDFGRFQYPRSLTYCKVQGFKI